MWNMRKKPLTIKTEQIKQWFESCNPEDTQVRDALKRAAKMIWQYQTHREQESATTIEHNGIGYNGYDADFASRLIHWRGTLPVKMAFSARKMLRKYARQLARISLRKETNQNLIVQDKA